MNGNVLVRNQQKREIEIARGLEGYKFSLSILEQILSQLESLPNEDGTVLYNAITEVLGNIVAKEYLVRITIPQDATFPYEIEFKWEKDINDNPLPTNITNVFISDLHAIDLERDVILTEYDRKGFSFRMGRYGQPITADWILQFIIKGGYS